MPEGARLAHVGFAYAGEVTGACFKSNAGVYRKYASLRELEDKLEMAAQTIIQLKMKIGKRASA
jgi:hypothetical protein